MQEEQYQNLNYTAQLRGDVFPEQQQMLIQELIVRFKDKPRMCKKANDSLIGSSKRILYVYQDTLYYYKMIQEFQDLDIAKLEYTLPKAGIKLVDIVSLSFPPRKKKDRNYFSITVPKNKILKYGKNKEIVVDLKAKGQLNWTFIFTYDIVSLPEKQERVLKEIERQKKLLQTQNEFQRREKQRMQKQEIERQDHERQRQKKFELFLIEKEDVKKEDAEVLKSKQMKPKQKHTIEEVSDEFVDINSNLKKRLENSYEYHFHTRYRLLSNKLSINQVLGIEYKLLEIIGDFRVLAIENTKQLINEMIFDQNSRVYKYTPDRGYYVNQTWIKFGGKNINQEFIGMSNVADILAILKKNRAIEMRVPLAALVKYKGFKALCVMNIPINGDDTIIYGLPSEGTFRPNSSVANDLKDICKWLNLRPYLSQVRFLNVNVYLDPRCQVHQSQIGPQQDMFNKTNQNKQAQDKATYIINLREIFPVDINLQESINQADVRLRPQYVHSINEQPLSGGAFLYSIDNADGELEDLTVAKANETLRFQIIPSFVKKLDRLDIILIDSKNIIDALHSHGVNIRYLSKIAKMTQLPYVKELMQIEVISRCVKKIFRQQQTEYTQEGFRSAFPDLFKLITKNSERRANNKLSIKENQVESAYLTIKKKQIVQKFGLICKQMAIDFLNLVFGNTQQTYAFWQIIRKQCLEVHQIEIDVLPTVTTGALLHGILYHCSLQVKYDTDIRLFMSSQPFKESDWVDFVEQSRIYEYPSFEIQKKAQKSTELLMRYQQIQLGVNSLNLQLAIQRALRSSQHYQHCTQPQQAILVKLSNYTQVRQPECPLYHPSLLPYFIANVTEDNFLKAHKTAEFCLPITHPLYISFYMAYSKLYDKEVMCKSALLVAIRGLGMSHWKTCQLLSQADVGNLEALRKAWISSKQTSGMAVLCLVRRLSEVGNLVECLQRCSKGYKVLSAQGQNSYKATSELLIIAIKSAYHMREIETMLQYTEKMWKNLEAYDRDNLEMYYILYWYSLKVFLECSELKRYFYKLILVLRDHLIKAELPKRKVQSSYNYQSQKQEQQQDKKIQQNSQAYFPEAKGEERKLILTTIIVLSRESKYHLDFLKSMMSRLEYGYKTLNFVKNFFTRFQQHLDSLNNEDYEQALQYLYLMGRLFGQKYFEDALITGIFFAPRRTQFVDQND